MAGLKMTALDYASDRENVVVRFASTGSPSGLDIAWIPAETDLPFDLAKIVGEVDDDGEFTATNLNDGVGDAHGWKFSDWAGNSIHALWLRVDPEVWAEQYGEFMGPA